MENELIKLREENKLLKSDNLLLKIKLRTKNKCIEKLINQNQCLKNDLCGSAKNYEITLLDSRS